MEIFPTSASRTHVSSLPPQLLALVLARVEQAERLGTMARVCSAWRTAAVMATSSIRARCGVVWGQKPSGDTQGKATALSDWLQAHAAAAALDSLAVRSEHWRHPPTLHLPVQQLASLRSLELERINVVVQGGADTQTAPPELPLELSGVTRLRLYSAGVGLSTLPAFTNLQDLALAQRLADSSSLELSGLLQLTHLHLCNDCAQDAVLASVSGLTSLQELALDMGCYTANGFAALPPSLTKLYVCGNVTLSPGSTPAMARLTALQRLEVVAADGFSTAVLCSMGSLQHLEVSDTPLLPAASAGDGGNEAARGVDLSMFSGLTQLQHLELRGYNGKAAGREADVAAHTASSQLTCLNVKGLIQQQQYRKMFPEGRQLPQLRELTATMGLLGTNEAVKASVGCCRNLERPEVVAVMYGEPVLEVFSDDDRHDLCSVASLCTLHSLTRLAMDVTGSGLRNPPECGEVFWRSMAELKGLRDLHINDLSMKQFGGIVELTSCRQLTHLSTDHSQDCYIDFDIKTPEGQPPDIWHRLPQEALQAALQYYKVNFTSPEGALRSMAWAAAQHALELDREVRREVGELRATVAGLESRLQQQDERQQQEVAELQAVVAGLERRQEQDDRQRQEAVDLQATVAAMGAQLQALLQQNNMQQG